MLLLRLFTRSRRAARSAFPPPVNACVAAQATIVYYMYIISYCISI